MLNINKLLPILFSIPLSVFAQDYNSAEYKEFVRNQYVEYKQAYQVKSKACYEQGLKAKFSDESINKIKKLDLTPEQLQASIIYFLYEANLKCQGISPIMTVGSLNEARTLDLKGYTKETDPAYKNLNALLVDTQAILRAKFVFLKLPKEKQEVLLNIDELKKPFDLNILSKITQ